MSYLEELLPDFRNGAKIRQHEWNKHEYIQLKNGYIQNQDGDEVLDHDISFYEFFEDNWELHAEVK